VLAEFVFYAITSPRPYSNFFAHIPATTYRLVLFMPRPAGKSERHVASSGLRLMPAIRVRLHPAEKMPVAAMFFFVQDAARRFLPCQ